MACLCQKKKNKIKSYSLQATHIFIQINKTQKKKRRELFYYYRKLKKKECNHKGNHTNKSKPTKQY